MELKIEIINGDCLDVLKKYPDNYFDSVVTDPPYGLSFMGKKWDYQIPSVEIWKEIFRVLKSGGHIFVACGTRTQHRMAVNIEDAGFEIRDVITWHYGSGFPKSLDVSKSIDKLKGAERKVVGQIQRGDVEKGKQSSRTYASADANKNNKAIFGYGVENITEPSSDEAKQWNGWGTALKPATEFFTLARKPLLENTVAKNVLTHGTGAINIDGCRIGNNIMISGGSLLDIRGNNFENSYGKERLNTDEIEKNGRFPANVIFTHRPDCVCTGFRKIKGTSTGNGEAEEGEESNGAITPIRRGKFTDRTDESGEETIEEWKCVQGCPIKELDEQSGILTSGAMTKPYMYQNNGYSLGKPTGSTKQIYESSEGGASRFFYCAKASKSERNKGLKNFSSDQERKTPMAGRGQGGLKCKICNKWKNSGSPCVCENPDFEEVKFNSTPNQNHHPTVKPVKLMQYLVKMITPQNGKVLDPFNGSGTTGIACKLEGFNYIGIEREAEYCEISRTRIYSWHEDLEYEKQMEIYRKEDGEEEENTNQLDMFE